ncbi:MAG: sialate O-acetylesterase [Opitutaceae bacterium]|nr:sialate O-acetylesterase [Opitutaceae bacterium]
MKLRSPFLVCAALALLSAASALADITLAPLFRDGAVLQRDQPLVVWGRAAAAEKVEVRFRGQSASAITGADGRWRVTLAPEKGSAVPSELVAVGANTVTVKDVLVGEVWLCSGQSNMGMMVRSANDADREMAAANFPQIRQFRVPNVASARRAEDVAGNWVACSPASVGNFSAVAYYFARDLHKRLGVPVGIVNSSWGGTQLEGWMSEETLKESPHAQQIFSRWETRLKEYPAAVSAHEKAQAKWETDRAAAQAAGKAFNRKKGPAPEGPGSRWIPGGLYNAMIAPLVPYAFRGVLWYQGEANATRHTEYASLFRAMIKQWRADFCQPLPFYFVQLANYEMRGGNTGDLWAFQREAQAQALTLPNTGMVVTIDVGDPKDLHPKNKQEVGRRLALLARRHLFGERIEAEGPVFAAAKPEGAAMRVTFSRSGVLKLEPSRGDGRLSFEVAGADQVFVPAEAKLDGRTLLVSAESVPNPVAVRYAWRNSPEARLFSAGGLPAAPFRSDKW